MPNGRETPSSFLKSDVNTPRDLGERVQPDTKGCPQWLVVGGVRTTSLLSLAVIGCPTQSNYKIPNKLMVLQTSSPIEYVTKMSKTRKEI